MYFNHAFRKSFLPALSQGQVVLAPAVTYPDTSALVNNPGQIGVFDAKTFTNVVATPSAKPFIIAQGSYFTSDKIGGNRFLGGYQESVKSKVINPKYITRLIRVVSKTAQNQKKEVCVCNLECGKTYRLRLDLKGSPALRLLSHNIYRILDAFTGCCTDDCSATCTGALVNPTTVVINWAKQIVENPILNQYLKVSVSDYGVGPAKKTITQASTSEADIKAFVQALDEYTPTAPWNPDADGADALKSCITLEAAYIDTKFGSCTFTPTDFYELMPLFIIPSMTDETGDPCNVQCVTISGENGVPEVQVPRQASGLGETILREMILDGRYLQNAYPDSTRVDSLRMREIEADPALATINRNGLYDQILILHSVPRFYNPTGTFDNDQYLLKFHVPAGTNTTALTNYITAAAAAAGNNELALETIS